MKFFGVLKTKLPSPCFRVAIPNIGVSGGGGGRVRQSPLGCIKFFGVLKIISSPV